MCILIVEKAANILNAKNNVEFSLGFVFDGYYMYRNLSRSQDIKLQALSRLDVYIDPIIHTFMQSYNSEVLVSHIKLLQVRMHLTCVCVCECVCACVCVCARVFID